MSVSGTSAREAARSKPMDRVARAGMAARGGVYVLFGVIALMLAIGNHAGETDQRGAMQALASKPGGSIVVWVLAAGLFGYALWRLAVAAFGSSEASKPSARVKSAISGIIYLMLGISAVKIASDSGAGSQAGQQELLTAKAMQHTGGRWLVGVVGVVIVVVGGYLVYEGIEKKFEKHFDLAQMSRTQRRVVEFLGMFGTTARGVVFALAGVFVIVAAVNADPKKARGLDGALHELQDMTGGPFLLGLVAFGLVAFGLFGFAEARWRRTGADTA